MTNFLVVGTAECSKKKDLAAAATKGYIVDSAFLNVMVELSVDLTNVKPDNIRDHVINEARKQVGDNVLSKKGWLFGDWLIVEDVAVEVIPWYNNIANLFGLDYSYYKPLKNA